MSKITPSGSADNDIFNDFSIFNMQNVIIGQYAAKAMSGGGNTIVGAYAGNLAFNLNTSVLLGYAAGKNIITGDNNYIIGGENTCNFITNNLVNIGYNNVNKHNSLTIGNNINNNANDFVISPILKYDNCSNININKYVIGEKINLGLNNSNIDGINIGNYVEGNNKNKLNIGNSNIFNNKSIIIGNNINNYKFSINIDNFICKYNEKNVIYLGIGFYKDIPIIVGSKRIENFNYNDSNLFINGALSTSYINFENDLLTIKLKENKIGNYEYYLPKLPDIFDNIFLSTDKYGKLKWIEVTDIVILIISTFGDTFCNDITSSNIYAKGSFLKDTYISDKNTDLLVNGIRNNYLTNTIITNYFLKLTSNISTDILNDYTSKSNLYYKDYLYTSNFINHIGEINIDKIQSSSNIKFYLPLDYDLYSKYVFKSYRTNDLKEGTSNIFFNLDTFSNYSSNIFNIVKEGTRNFYYTYDRYFNAFNTYILSNNTNILKQGTSNLYYNYPIASNVINTAFNKITTDELKEGNCNLYVSDERIVNIFNERIITTTDIKGTANLYYYNSNNNYLLKGDLIKQGTNSYFNRQNTLNIITLNATTDILKNGKSNIYTNENVYVSELSKITSNKLTSDNLNDNTLFKFIKNNFYNNDLNINGYIKASNVNNIDFEALRGRIDELTIGPKTNVVNTYNVNTFNVNNRLSNLEIVYSYSNYISNVVPFIVIDNKVGIHNTRPRYELDVNGYINCSNLFINNSSFNNLTDGYIKYDINCNVGIGTSFPLQRLHVVGNIISSGTITSSFSDIRLKDVICPLNNSLNIIKNLNGFKYKPNAIAKEMGCDLIEDIGLNAQEVNEYIPEIIKLAPIDMTVNERGEFVSKSGNNYLSIQYDRLIPYLVEAIKELTKEVEFLKEQQKKFIYQQV